MQLQLVYILAQRRYRGVIIIPHIETNMHSWFQVINWVGSWRAAAPIGWKRGMLTVEVIFGLSLTSRYKIHYFFSLPCPPWCAQRCLECNVQVVCVCVCVWMRMYVRVWLMYYAVPYSNYIVCLSRTVVVPLFVVALLPEHARNAIPALAVFWQTEIYIYSLTMPTCMYGFVAGLIIVVIIEFANVCTEYLLDHRWDSGFRLRRRLLILFYAMHNLETPTCVKWPKVIPAFSAHLWRFRLQ